MSTQESVQVAATLPMDQPAGFPYYYDSALPSFFVEELWSDPALLFDIMKKRNVDKDSILGLIENCYSLKQQITFPDNPHLVSILVCTPMFIRVEVRNDIDFFHYANSVDQGEESVLFFNPTDVIKYFGQ